MKPTRPAAKSLLALTDEVVFRFDYKGWCPLSFAQGSCEKSEYLESTARGGAASYDSQAVATIVEGPVPSPANFQSP